MTAAVYDMKTKNVFFHYFCPITSTAALFPPASAVEGIESVPPVCLFVCLSVI